MKHYFKLLIILFLLPIISACAPTSKSEGDESSKQIKNVDLSTYLEEMTFPDRLSIAFDPKEVSSQASVTVYTASPLKIDENIAIKELLQKDVTSTEYWAEGPQFHTGDETWKEIMTVFDGGKSVDMESGIYGGLSYSIYKDGVSLGSKMETVVSNTQNPPDITEQLYMNRDKNDFSSFIDLDFKEYNHALSSVKSVLSKVGFPNIELAKMYSLDLDTILKHYKRYENMIEHVVKPDDNYQWSKDDEAYLFLFQQTLDNIPISNLLLPEGTLLAAGISPTNLSVLYDKDGIADIYSNNLFGNFIKEKDVFLINETIALNSVIDFYSDKIIDNETEIISMELRYVNVEIDKENYKLTPVWIFTIVEHSVWDDPVTGKIDPIEEYSWIVIDAITGEFIIKGSDN